MVVNVGRGAHLVEDDLLAALDCGQLQHAVIDVLESEPPPEHRFWDHPGITLTPHVAGMTQSDSAVQVVIDNRRRFQAGQPLPGLVDRQAGYRWRRAASRAARRMLSRSGAAAVRDRSRSVSLPETDMHEKRVD